MGKHKNLQLSLKGPVYPVCPAFKEDHSFDPESTSEYANYLISNDAKILMVTAGTSRFNLLTEAEIKTLNKLVVDAGKGKTISIAANPMSGSTDKAIEFARYSKDIGADIILLYYPERYYNDDRVIAYYDSIAQSTDIGIMIHAMPMRNAKAGPMKTVPYTVELSERLSQIENIFSMKEESGDIGLRYKLAERLRDKMSFIVAGGSMRTFLSCVLYGFHGFLVGIGSIKPQIEEKFYSYVLNKEYDKALYIVDHIEKPFFDVAFKIGWHIAMKGAMGLSDLMPSYERPPLQRADKSEKAELKQILDKILSITDY